MQFMISSLLCYCRPYTTVDTYTVAESTGETIPEEKLTCDLCALMSCRDI